jgi:hypothetical protein
MVSMQSPSKACSRCGVVKPLTEFGKVNQHSNGGYKDGLDYRCKACTAKKAKEYQARLKLRPTRIVSEKRCYRCGVTKPSSAFTKNRTTLDWLEAYCRECKYAQNKTRESQLGYQRRRHLWRSYQLTEAQLRERLASQDGKCAICRLTLRFDVAKGLRDKVHIDHCHRTGRIRGLLCRDCNWALGTIERDGFLKKAVDYLNDPQYENEFRRYRAGLLQPIPA